MCQNSNANHGTYAYKIITKKYVTWRAGGDVEYERLFLSSFHLMKIIQVIKCHCEVSLLFKTPLLDLFLSKTCFNVTHVTNISRMSTLINTFESFRKAWKPNVNP